MHTTGAITPYIDISQLTLYAFWIFFAGLVIYLTLESKREGFPLITSRPGERLKGLLPLPKPKTFILHDGTTRSFPWAEPLEELNMRQTSNFEGAAWEPLGNPMQDGVGPASYAQRADVPELTHEGEHRTVPMRIAEGYSVASDDPDPRGFDVIAGDGKVAGTVSDIWVDRTSCQARWIEVALPDANARRVVVPMELARVVAAARGGRVHVVSVTAEQFTTAPVPANPESITAREEDRIAAYFASGHLYALPSRMEPLI
ncbi:MAG: photosynthetic reaction center subunit H [Acidocella sp. 20-57-95]|nr:MAG: photosynthetic reaction center subunit H [Acidocella sp. 20-57-95]HQT64851.1 photosynthetic reaction center subunit H [Acidocella sp.]HQU05321.1 photosynthetic reaction center subunit H [Acidocella sp.]